MTNKSGIFTWEEKDRVGFLKISSGEKGNAVPRPDFSDHEIVAQWLNNEEIEGVIVSGTGRHFSSGADLGYFKGKEYTREALERQCEPGEEILSCLSSLEKPVIASIDGACLGLGFEIALACHMRFCSRDALFGFPEIGHGIIPGQGGLQRLFANVGKSRTLEIALTGEVFGAEPAKRYGIVNSIVQDKTAFNYTFDFMAKIIEMGRKPVKFTIRSVNNASRLDFQSAVKEECHMFAELVMEQYINRGGPIGKQGKDNGSG